MKNNRSINKKLIREGSPCRFIGTEKGPAVITYPRRWVVYFDGSPVKTFRGPKRQVRAKAYMKTLGKVAT